MAAGERSRPSAPLRSYPGDKYNSVISPWYGSQWWDSGTIKDLNTADKLIMVSGPQGIDVAGGQSGVHRAAASCW
jgi:hypothetical protein